MKSQSQAHDPMCSYIREGTVCTCGAPVATPVKTAEDVRNAVVELWNREGGWIPGAAYQRLAEALDVDPRDLIHYNWETRTRHRPEGLS